MRIPSGVTDQYIYFVGVDATDFTTRETGLSSFTVYRSRNGGAAAAMTTPTVNETDTTNMPGVYELLLDEDMTIDAGDDEQEMVFHITHAGMAPVTRVVTLFRPKLTVGNTLTVESDGDLAKVNALDGHTAQTADHTAGIADVPTVAEFNARTLAAADYFDPAADAVATVTDVTNLHASAATAANQTTVLNRLGAFTASGVNTVLGFFQALMRSDATTPSDLGGTYDDATDSLQAIRDRGDAAWTTGAGGSATDMVAILGALSRDSSNTYHIDFGLFENGQPIASGSLSSPTVTAVYALDGTDLNFSATSGPTVVSPHFVRVSGTLASTPTDDQPVKALVTVDYSTVTRKGVLWGVPVS